MATQTKIKPTDIFQILDLTVLARKQNKTFIPCFAGDAGLGKSEICQAWVKVQQKRNPKFFFLDLRLAYMESPDLIGLPKVCSETNRTTHILPDFWPSGAQEGLILFEEPNRANASVMNTQMQVFTDRKIHGYTLPEGVIMAIACNQESSAYDVNTMDAALKNRLAIYNVGYDHKSFVDFITKNNWNPILVGFIKSGTWVYKATDELGAEGFYISPRTLSMLNNAMSCGLEQFDDIFYSTVVSLLGSNIGREFYKWVKNIKPLLSSDFVEDPKDAFKRLNKFCDTKSYKGDIINILIDSLIENFQKLPEINVELICKISHIIAKDQVHQLIGGCTQNTELKLEDFLKHDPTLKGAITNTLRG